MKLEVTDDERDEFIYDCRSWGEYDAALQTYDKLKVLKIIKYFLTERMSAKRMLTRAVSRFNKLNMLKVGDLR